MTPVTYGSVRIGLYESLKQNAEQEHIPLNPPVLGLMAGVSGFVGAMFGNPSDIANIRMQNDWSLPEHARRNYRHVFDAWVQMKRHESWTVFWQGLWPNCFRCGLMTMCQLGSYDYFKSMLMKMTGSLGEHSAIHLSASLLASLVATTLCSPIDVVKTQLMGSSQQGSAIRAVKDLTTTHGPRWIFRGWMPSFIRMGPQTVMTLVLLEQHKRIYRIITQRQ
jgi:dicarboxylate transporter 10